MSSDTSVVLSVTLLAQHPIHISYDALHKQLQHTCTTVDSISSNLEKQFYIFAYPKYPVQYKEGSIPAQTLIHFHSDISASSFDEAAFQQSWEWRSAREVVTTCRYGVMVADLMANGLDPQQRVELFNNVLLSLLTLGTFEAMYWKSSQQFLPVSAYRSYHQGSQPNPFYGFLNVRMFNIANRAPGETLMDTMGLATLGLPDLQCHFVGLDPEQVARMLYNTGLYLFQNGDVIEDGHTVAGITPDSRWVCKHEDALVQPNRLVIDINPGSPHAAGNRG